MAEMPPEALLRLLACLEASRPSIQELEVDLSDDEFGGYFTTPLEDQGEGSSGAGNGVAMHMGGTHRSQLRLRVLTAIANCRSLRKIRLNLGRFIVYSVTEAEATAFFRGLQSNPVLDVLDVRGWRGFGTAAACEALAGLLRSSRTLRDLYLGSVGLTGEGLGHIAAALQANRSSILRRLNVSGNRIGDAAGHGAQHLADILASTPALQALEMVDISMDAAGGEVIANALAHNTTLELLTIGWDLDDIVYSNESAPLTRILAALSGAPVGAAGGHGLADASPFNTSVTQLGLLVWVVGQVEPIAPELGEALAHMLRSNVTLVELTISTSLVGHGLEALRHNTSITRLRVFHQKGDTTVDPDKLILIVHSCQTLQRLTYISDVPSEFKKQVFRSLKDNPSIRDLDIEAWEDLDDDMFKDLMESLQVNTNLEEIHVKGTSWERQGKKATIDRTLRRNKLLKRQVAYLDILHHGDVDFTSPKAARLFLCGFGFAGKTTLRKSMIHSRSKLSSFPASLPWSKSRRTQGIEIQMLRDDDTMQVSIWDLAGQDKFRALQSFLFPSISQACIFAFVFSCYDRETHKSKPEKSLDEELRHWMRFIASNSSNQGHVIPQVFVILTHLDKMPPGTSEAMMVDWAMPTITQAKKDFAGLLNISSEVFALKSSSATSVAPLLRTLFELFEKLLSKELKVVPEPCTRMSTILAQWRSNNRARPMMPLQEFQDLCFKEVRELGKFGKQDETAVKILEAIASYLHDVGTIMFFKKAQIVVVDPNWVSHVFLGSLIGVGPGDHQRSSKVMPSTTDGFVAKSQVEATLAHFLKDNKYKGLNMQDLIGLMLELELCCEVEVAGVTRYLVPHTLDDANGNALSGRRQLHWPLPNHGSDSIHIGSRLQCSDQLQTHLGPGFFSRFQVSLRNRLFAKQTEISMEPHQYALQLNLITFYTDGIEVLVEIPGDVGDYVDILVRSSKAREQTRAFVLAHVVEELRSFCASPEGSQGVTLVEGIIRPECVRRLTLCVYRRGQTVLKQELKELAEKRIMNTKCGEIFTSVGSIDYVHTWNKVPEAKLDTGFENALKLLEPEDILDVLTRKERFVQQKLIDVEEAAQEVLGKSHGKDKMRETTMDRPGATYNRIMSAPIHRSCHQQVLHQEIRAMKETQERVEGKMDRVEGKIDEIKSSQEQVLNTIKVLQDRTLVTVACKMNEIMNFSAALVKSKVPNRPYFTTDDVGKVQKLVAGIHMSKAMKLHFMCEDTRGPHVVKGQDGLELSMVDAKWKWIQPIALQSARMLVFLVKAGLHVAAGIGSAIPDFAQWTGAIPLTVAALAGESLLNNINLQVDGSSVEQSKCVEDAWVFLKEELEPHLKPEQMGRLFQLYRVEFVGGPQRGVGWVCQKCLARGRSEGTILTL